MFLPESWIFWLLEWNSHAFDFLVWKVVGTWIGSPIGVLCRQNVAARLLPLQIVDLLQFFSVTSNVWGRNQTRKPEQIELIVCFPTCRTTACPFKDPLKFPSEVLIWSISLNSSHRSIPDMRYQIPGFAKFALGCLTWGWFRISGIRSDLVGLS